MNFQPTPMTTDIPPGECATSSWDLPSQVFAGLPAEPGNLENLARDLNFICPGPKIAWNSPKVRKPRQNEKFIRKHEVWCEQDFKIDKDSNEKDI